MPRVNRGIAFILLLCVAFVLVIALLQLSLASQATATIRYLASLETETSMLQAEYDELQAEAEKLRTPLRIEVDATLMGLKPIEKIEYGN